MLNPELSVPHPLVKTPTAETIYGRGREQVLIRPAMVDDALVLARIITDSFHQYSDLRQWFVPLLRLGVCEDLRHRLRFSDHGERGSPQETGRDRLQHVCFVACLPLENTSQSLIVGTVEVAVKYVSGRVIAPMKLPYISNLAVAPDYRRLGIARQLLQRCEVQVQRWHYGSIGLHVLETNQGAMELYRQLGYQVQQTEQTLGSWFFAQPKQLFLQKNLSR